MTADNNKSLIPINGQLSLVRLGEIISITNSLLPIPKKNVLIVDDRVNNYNSQKDDPKNNHIIKLFKLEFKEFFGDRVNLIGYVDIVAAANFLRANYRNIDLVISDALYSDPNIMGWDVLKLAKNLDSSIPCITHTAYDFHPGFAEAKQYEALVQKSADTEGLLVVCGILLYPKNIFMLPGLDKNTLCNNISHILNLWGADEKGTNQDCNVLYLNEPTVNRLKAAIERC